MGSVQKGAKHHQSDARGPGQGCLARFGCVLVLLIALAASALAQTWDGGGANANWSNLTNWNPDAALANDGTARLNFAGASGLSPHMDQDWSIRSITFTNNAGAFTLTSGAGLTLTLSGGITNNSANVQTINIGNITLGAAQTWNARSNHLVFGSAIDNGGFLLTIDGANHTTLNGILSGVGGLTKAGAGTLTLAGNNTLSGTITLSGGTLSIGHDSALGTGGLTIAANTTIQSDGSSRTLANTVTASGNFTVGGASDLTFSGDVNLSANRTITVDNTGVTTISGRLGQTSGTPTFTKAGSGTLVLSGSNNLANSITVSAGVLNVRHANALGTTGSGTTVSSGAALELEGGISIGAEALTLNGSGISLGGALRNVSGNNSHAGAITLGAATLIASDAGTVTLSGAINNGGFGLTVGGAGSMNLSGVISGTGGLTKTNTGTVTLSGSGANIYDGDTLVTHGVLLLNKSVANGAVTDTLTLGTATDAPDSAIVRHLAGQQIDSGKGTGLTLKNSGWLDLNGFNDTVKITSLEGGRITTGTGTLTLASHLTYSASATNTTTISGNLALGGNRDFNINDGAHQIDMLVDAVISGASSINKKLAGRLVLAGSNTYSGSTTVSAGQLRILHDNALGSTNGTTTVNSGAALEVAGTINVGAQALTLNGTGIAGTGALRNLSGTNSWAGNVTFGAATTVASDAGLLTLNGALSGSTFVQTYTGAGDLRVNGSISGSGAINKSGAGTLTFAGSNTFSGAVTVSNGVLNVRHGAALGTTAAGTTVRSGAELQVQGDIAVGAEALTLNGSGVSGSGALRNLSGHNSWAGAITLGSDATIGSDSGTLSLTNIANGGFAATLAGAGDVSVNGVISGTGTLVKEGTGTAIFIRSNTFSGATTINAGSLVVSANGALGTTNAATTVGSGGTLGFQGNVNYASAEPVTLHGAGAGNGGALKNVSGNNSFAGPVTLGSAASIGSDSGTLTLNGTINNAGHTLTLTGAGNVTVAGVISGSGGLTKDGAGTATLAANNTFTGTVRVNQGTLLLGSSERIANSANLELNGGTFATGGHSETLGTMTLLASSTIDFGSGSSVLTFANSSAATWTGSLEIVNWSGTRSGGGTDQLHFGSAGGLTSAQLAQVLWRNPFGAGDVMGADMLGNGEIVPVPEPGTVLALAAILGLLAWRERRWLARKTAALFKRV